MRSIAVETESIGPEPVAVSSPERLPLGSVVAGRYEIRGVLGSGGYAVVYRAHDRELDAEVALKTLRSDRNSASALTRLRREVSVARGVFSPHLVRIYDIGTDGDLCYLTMEVVKGESLREKLRRGPLPIQEALAITTGILQGLAALHGAGVIHRDLKPENILLTASGTPTLADFGLARFLDDDRSKATATGAVIGTTDYLSPEQALGQSVDARGDLYACGVVLFEMLTGRVPFESESSLGNVIARLRTPAPSVRKFRRDTPFWLASVIARLLAKSPQQRYRGSTEALAAIRRRRVDVRAVTSWRRAAVVAAAAAAISVGIVFAPPREATMRFTRIDPAGEQGIVAIGNRGETLWRIGDVPVETRWTLARVERGRPPVLAAVLLHKLNFLPESRQTLSLLDPDSGKVVHEVKLPSAAAEFRSYTDRYQVRTLAAEDLDGDGIDEIIVGYNHLPEAPSYFIVYEPALERTRTAFVAMGGHWYAGAQDLDGDGRKELVLGGINNGVNWYNAFCALRLDPPIGQPGPTDFMTAGPVRSPDMYNRNESDLLWYMFLPRGLPPQAPPAYQWDSARRQITLSYANRPPVVVSYDGFLESDASTLGSAAREKFRRSAWMHYCKSKQLLAGNFSEGAVVEAKSAVADAEKAFETILIEVMRCALAKALVSAGHEDEAQAMFEKLAATSESAMELSYDAGRAFHLHGNLDRALAWYRRGLSAASETMVGKSKHEYIQAIVFALGERGQWDRAIEEIDGFTGIFSGIDLKTIARYREFVRWRNGGMPHNENLETSYRSTDLFRYWELEFRAARGEAGAKILPDVEREIAWNAEPLAPLWSLKAEVLARSGRTSDAAEAVRTAWEIGQVAAKHNLIARAHLSLIRERLIRYGGASAPK